MVSLKVHQEDSRKQETFTTGDGGNQEDFVAVPKSVFRATREADVLVVHVNVHEAQWRAVRRTQRLLDAGMFLLQPVEELGEIPGCRFDDFRAARESAQRWRDADGYCQEDPPKEDKSKSKGKGQKAKVKSENLSNGPFRVGVSTSVL
jgi:hypothetical protein